MIVTDKFVFVHFPRTGGTFITAVIMRLFPSAREIGYHLPRFLLPNEYSHLPVLGGVRNPWEFYVSWYYHVWPRDAANSAAFMAIRKWQAAIRRRDAQRSKSWYR